MIEASLPEHPPDDIDRQLLDLLREAVELAESHAGQKGLLTEPLIEVHAILARLQSADPTA